MTHDVFADVIADLGGHLRRVEITDLTDNTFHACLMVDQAGNEHTIDIRPSDAVALAVRTETPIYVEKAVFDQAGIVATEATADATDEPDSSERKGGIDESKLSPFKEFIDTLEMDDIGAVVAKQLDESLAELAIVGSAHEELVVAVLGQQRQNLVRVLLERRERRPGMPGAGAGGVGLRACQHQRLELPGAPQGPVHLHRVGLRPAWGERGMVVEDEQDALSQVTSSNE